MDKVKGWNVTTARKQFAKVLRAAEHAPQYVYRRGKVAAVVVAPGHLPQSGAAAPAPRWATMQDALDEIKRVAQQEQYTLRTGTRANWSPEFRKMKRAISR